MSEFPRGRFVWYQLNAVDLDAATAFYADLIGFDLRAWDASENPYILLNRGDSPIGGAMPLPEEARAGGAPQHWLAYIATPDVDMTVMQAKDLGANVYVPPTDLPEVGRFSVISDPQGATVCFFTPATPPEDTPFAPERCDVSWHELMTTDREAAFSFYQNLFAWRMGEAMDMGDTGIYQLFGRRSETLGGIFTKTREMPAPPNWLLYFKVKSVDERVERLQALGGQVTSGPVEVPGGDRVVQCMDPQGGVFALHSTQG